MSTALIVIIILFIVAIVVIVSVVAYKYHRSHKGLTSDRGGNANDRGINAEYSQSKGLTLEELGNLVL